jgi:hypothetical protein
LNALLYSDLHLVAAVFDTDAISGSAFVSDYSGASLSPSNTLTRLRLAFIRLQAASSTSTMH